MSPQQILLLLHILVGIKFKNNNRQRLRNDELTSFHRNRRNRHCGKCKKDTAMEGLLKNLFLNCNLELNCWNEWQKWDIVIRFRYLTLFRSYLYDVTDILWRSFSWILQIPTSALLIVVWFLIFSFFRLQQQQHQRYHHRQHQQETSYSIMLSSSKFKKLYLLSWYRVHPQFHWFSKDTQEEETRLQSVTTIGMVPQQTQQSTHCIQPPAGKKYKR